jgi:hypothetical protein
LRILHGTGVYLFVRTLAKIDLNGARESRVDPFDKLRAGFRAHARFRWAVAEEDEKAYS